MAPPLTGMLFLPVSLPRHVVGTQEAHPLRRAVFAATEEEEIKGRELLDVYGERTRGGWRDDIPGRSPGREARSLYPVPWSKDVGVEVSGR